MQTRVTGQYRAALVACALALGLGSAPTSAQNAWTAVEPATLTPPPAPRHPPMVTFTLPPAASPAIGKVWLDADALFDFGKADLRPAGRGALDDFVARLKDVKSGVIHVVGHSDRLGSDSHNRMLSEDRAQAVKAYLVGKGIEPDRVRAEGRGETQPVTKAGACPGGKSAQVITCLQPDRRVGIETAGTQSIK